MLENKKTSTRSLQEIKCQIFLLDLLPLHAKQTLYEAYTTEVLHSNKIYIYLDFLTVCWIQKNL